MLNIFITENVSRDAAVMLYVLVSFSCQNQPWSSVGQLSSEECRLCRRRFATSTGPACLSFARHPSLVLRRTRRRRSS